MTRKNHNTNQLIQKRQNRLLKGISGILAVVMFTLLFVMPFSVAATDADKVNLFDKNSTDNWLQALSYKGAKYTAGSYDNMFATHEIAVTPGQTLTWGPYGYENYCLEWWDNTGAYKGQVKTELTQRVATGNSVMGVGKTVVEYMLTYKFDAQPNISKVRFLGNISNMDKYGVYVVADSTGPSVKPLPMTPHETATALHGKSILFVGDSLVSAQKDDYNNGGWAKRIGVWNEMTWTNKGVSGASVSTVTTSRIIPQLISGTFDYVVLEGGINDALKNAPIGTLTAKDVTTGFDKSTFAGALEELLSTAKAKYPTAKIGFIIAYSTPNSNWGGRTKDFKAETEIMIAACEKWGISYIDLYSGKTADGKLYSKDILKTDTPENLYAKDAGEIHISGAGYDVITPYLEQWLISLPEVSVPEVTTAEATTAAATTVEVTTAEPAGTPDTTAEKAASDSSCGSSASIALVVLVCSLGCALTLKRKVK